MKFTPVDPPRLFHVGSRGEIELKDCARIQPKANEQVTFLTESGGEFDVVRKEWGFYATPSLNGRLKAFGLRSVLVKNRQDKLYLLLVESGKESLFQDYIRREQQDIVCWLDTDEAVQEIFQRCRDLP